MNILIKTIYIITSTLLSSFAYSHGIVSITNTSDASRKIEFPDTKNYKVLVLDPHTHSTFSDGHVWPTMRVAEAIRDGLDAMAITEHLEWQPHLKDIPHKDRNRAFEIAAEASQSSELMVIAGTEITREIPYGHINALFINDANKIFGNLPVNKNADSKAYYFTQGQWPVQKAINEANQQGAFLIWNHSWWDRTVLDRPIKLSAFHLDNIKNSRIHGIEIVNGASYSPDAFKLALDLNITMIGSSDVHELIDWDYQPHKGGHRPVTLVLANKSTEKSLHNALLAGRTVVWFKNILLAREENMSELLNATLKVDRAYYNDKQSILFVEIVNQSDVNFKLRNTSRFSFFHNTEFIELGEHGRVKIGVRTNGRVKDISLEFEILNALISPKEHALIKLQVSNIAELSTVKKIQ